MNIFLIARGYPSSKEPTWGCFEKDQALALSEAGHQVTIISVDTRFRLYWRTLGIQRIVENKITAYNIFLLPYAVLFFLPRRIKDKFYAWQLEQVYKRAIKEQGTPDILYTHYLQNTHKAIRIHSKYNIPIVGIEHWSQMGFHPIPRSAIRLAKNTYPFINKLLTVSSALKDNILTLGFDSTVVPNIVSKDFAYLPTQRSSAPLQIVSTGRLVKGKRFDLLIQAIANIQHPVEVNIIGNGPEYNTLEHLIQELKLQDKIKLLGYKTKEEVVTILQKSDIFVLPSQSETFGVAYIEALSCGLPIIATDCGGPRDIVTPENGLLIPVDNLEALTQAILKMIDHLPSYSREHIAQDCQQRFAAEAIAGQLTSIFQEVHRQTH